MIDYVYPGPLIRSRIFEILYVQKCTVGVGANVFVGYATFDYSQDARVGFAPSINNRT